MLFARTAGLLVLVVSALTAQSLSREGRLGNHAGFQYPESWDFSGSGVTGRLSPPPSEPDPQYLESNTQISSGAISIQLLFVPALRNEGDPGEVASLLMGSSAGVLATRPERTMLGEQGGWIHSFRANQGGRMRVYALRLRTGGAVLVTVSGTERLVSSTRGTLESILRSVRSLDGKAEAASEAAPVAAEPEPVAAPRPPARMLPPEQEAKLIAEWQQTLTGHTWTAGRKLWKLSADGRYDFESVITIAGLDESAGRRTTDRGQWRVTVRDAEPWLELRPERGEPMWIACARSGEAVLIDGEPARRQ